MFTKFALWLDQYRLWAIKNGLTESLRKKYERHLVRITHLGIDIERKHSLKNRLEQIKRWVVSPDLQNLKKDAETVIEDELAKRPAERNIALTPCWTTPPPASKSWPPPGARSRTAFIRPGCSGRWAARR
ncbi:Uncharacterised protein [Klebsiella pneumoniae]|nr:Uncharacterised protein [Klebsiella pneumoniae]